MWPNCINNLSPVQHELRTAIPSFLEKAFIDAGIINKAEMFVPVELVAILGSCSTADYDNCPNMPIHHLENSQSFYETPAEYLEYIGRNYWFDFDIVGFSPGPLSMRLVFNEGDADCNDGMWGAVWEKNTEELIVNISSTGDGESTITAVSKLHIDIYESLQIWVPTDFGEPYDEDPLPCEFIVYANDLNLEKIVALAIRLCCTVMN
jgi:hypothetical protein